MDQLVREILKAGGDNKKSLVEAVNSLARTRGDEVYQVIFRILTGRSLETSTACRYWREAMARWESTAALRPAQQQIRSALLDYLHQVVGEKFDSVTDGLTGLYTSAFGKNHLEKLLAHKRSRNCREPLAFVLVAVDSFNEYHGSCGSLSGDRALRRIADILRQNLREMDVAARFGSDAFSLLLPDHNLIQACALAEKMRSAVEKASFPGAQPETSLMLTVSCGVSAYPVGGDTWLKLCREAERELSLARQSRNTIRPGCAERRRNQRQPICSLVEFAADAGKRFIPAVATDISSGGIAFGCDVELVPGTPLSLCLRRPHWPMNREISGTVRQVRRDERRQVTRVGLEFMAADDELGRLLPSLCSLPPAGTGGAAAGLA